FPVVHTPANRPRAVPLKSAEFHYAFANTVSRDESDSWRAKLAIPGPGRPLFQSALANFTPKSKAATVVDYAKPDRAPLLLVAGGRDHITPSSVVYENFTRYRRAPPPPALTTFPRRPRRTCAPRGAGT